MFNTRSSKQMGLWGIGAIIFILALVFAISPAIIKPANCNGTYTNATATNGGTYPLQTQPTAILPEVTPAYPPLHAELATCEPGSAFIGGR